MNLLTFAWRTAKMLFAIPLGFTYGAIATLGETHSYAALGCVFFAGLALFALALLKTEGHRRTLDRRNVQAYVRQLIHNKETYPFTLPDEQWAVDRVGKIFDQPLEP